MKLPLYDVIDLTMAGNIKTLLAAAGGADVVLEVNSPGGSVTDALAIYNMLKGYQGNVSAVVDGIAASAATVVLMGADQIVMAEHSMMMIHNPWLSVEGDADELRKHADTLDKATAELVKLYAERTGRSPEEIAEMLKAETWLTADEAVAAGFADSVAASDLVLIEPEEGDEPDEADQDDEEEPQARLRISSKALSFLQGITKRPELAAACGKRVQAHIADRQSLARTIAVMNANHRELCSAQKEFLKQPEVKTMTTKQFRAGLMDAMGRGITPTVGSHIHVDNGNAVRDGMVNALSARLGMASHKDRSPFHGMSLTDLARASLSERGVSMMNFGNKMQMVGAAFTHTTSDFGAVLEDVANKAMLQGWEQAGETFQQWTKAGVLSDFRTAKRAGMGNFPNLPKVLEGAEYTYISTDDHAEPITLATYGAIFSITRQAIINDDLSAFSSIPAKLGAAAARTIGDLVYAILTSNPKLADNKAIFHADHHNLITSASGLNPETLGDARRKMRLQTDSKGNTLNVNPAFVIVPAALESIGLQVLNSTAVPGSESNSGIHNPVANMGQLIVEPRLDAASANHWYLASAQGTDTIEVAYLDGQSVPYIEQQDGFTVDGTAFKVRIDAGVAPLDFRGLAKVENTPSGG